MNLQSADIKNHQGCVQIGHQALDLDDVAGCEGALSLHPCGLDLKAGIRESVDLHDVADNELIRGQRTAV